jgi:hypothetical protein
MPRPLSPDPAVHLGGVRPGLWREGHGIPGFWESFLWNRTVSVAPAADGAADVAARQLLFEEQCSCHLRAVGRTIAKF